MIFLPVFMASIFFSSHDIFFILEKVTENNSAFYMQDQYFGQFKFYILKVIMIELEN